MEEDSTEWKKIWIWKGRYYQQQRINMPNVTIKKGKTRWITPELDVRWQGKKEKNNSSIQKPNKTMALDRGVKGEKNERWNKNMEHLRQEGDEEQLEVRQCTVDQG